MWTWCNYLHSFVLAGKRVLRVNIDETSIKLDMDNKHGFMSAAAKSKRNIPDCAHNVQAPVPHCIFLRGSALRRCCIAEDDAADHHSQLQPVSSRRVRRDKKQQAGQRGNMAKEILLDGHRNIWKSDPANPQVTGKRRRFHPNHLVIGQSPHAHQRKDMGDLFQTAIHDVCDPRKTTGVLQPLDVYVFALLKST